MTALRPVGVAVDTGLVTAAEAGPIGAVWRRAEGERIRQVQFEDCCFDRGAEGERTVAALLNEAGFRCLHRRSWPGTSGDIDHLLVGPAGVAIVDTKNQGPCRISAE